MKRYLMHMLLCCTFINITKITNPMQNPLGNLFAYNKGGQFLYSTKTTFDRMNGTESFHNLGNGRVYLRIPNISSYSADNQRGVQGAQSYKHTIGIIEYTPAVAFQKLPDSIKRALAGNSITNGGQCSIFSIIYDLQKDTSLKTFNLVLHGYIAPFFRNTAGTKNYFNIITPVGLFELKNCAPNDLGNNTLQNFNINFHADIAFSPNNGTFTITNGAPFSSFYSVTVYENNALIVHHLLINTQAARDQILGIIDNNKTSMVNLVNALADSSDVVVKDFGQTIQKLSGYDDYLRQPQQTPSQQQPTTDPQELINALNVLRRSLYNLIDQLKPKSTIGDID